MADRFVDHLLIGGGIASATCAQELREAGATGSILLVARELDPPYHRPPITKGYLGGSETKDDTLIELPDDVEVLTRTSVMALDTGGQDRHAVDQGDGRVRHRAAGDRRDGPPAADRRRPPRRHPLPARARQRRLADRGRRDRRERGLRRRLLHRLRERGDADDARQARHGRPAGGGADGARVRPEGRPVGARRARRATASRSSATSRSSASRGRASASQRVVLAGGRALDADAGRRRRRRHARRHARAQGRAGDRRARRRARRRAAARPRRRAASTSPATSPSTTAPPTAAP